MQPLNFYTVNGLAVTKQYKFGTGVSWEGNRRSGVALACVTDNSGTVLYYHVRAHGLKKGDEHPPYTPVEYGTLYLFNGLVQW